VVLLLSSCIIFKPVKIPKIWTGRADLNVMMGERAAIEGLSYPFKMTLDFDWILDSSKIKGGTILFGPGSATGSRITYDAYEFTITGGSYNEETKVLRVTCTEKDVSCNLVFEGTVNTGSTPNEVTGNVTGDNAGEFDATAL
ncbi:MAG TPA: hypothetical protein PLF96_08445, partial [Thermotogota bacterium]|nr:hypothetical protein [Thermotogota bacterium]